MNRYNTLGIILARTNYGEADRIMTFLTPDRGKVQAIAKGVRKQKSKLAGGLELFSVSHLSLLVGKSEINTLISTKLKKHYGGVVTQLERTEAGYEMIKLLAKSTAEQPEKAYFDLLESGFEALDDTQLDWRLTMLWFDLHLLKLTGHGPNLYTDSEGNKLKSKDKYDFDPEAMCFNLSSRGHYSANHIKLARLAGSVTKPELLAQVKGSTELVQDCCNLVQPLTQRHFLRR